MTRHVARISLGTVVLLVSLACDSRPSEEPSGDSSPVPPSPPVVPALAPAPWSASRLPRDSVPAVYLAQWHKSENRATCAVLAPASLGDGAGAKPRAASFSGGWAVAYDRPGMRSAFGIAGTGSKASDEARVTGQECLYNVWSRLGVPHLEYLLSQLRFVESASTEE